MLRVLQRYVLREVMTPGLMALATLAFVLLVRMIFMQSDDFSGMLSLPVLLLTTFYFFPTLLTLAIPMAILTGVLLGIGRMTVDSEVKACRTHGVNLFKVFSPVLVCGGVASVIVFLNSLYFAPWMFSRSLSLLDRLRYEVIDSIQPGMFESVKMGKGMEMVIQFKDRDPETSEIENVKIWFEGAPGEVGKRGKKAAKKRATLEELKAKALGPIALADAAPDDALSTPTRASGRASDADDATTDTQSEEPTKTRFLASSGRIELDTSVEHPSAALVLRNGSIHVVQDEKDPRYSLVEFKQMRYEFRPDTDEDSARMISQAMTIGQLRRRIAVCMDEHARRVAEGTDEDGVTKGLKIARTLRGEMWQRYSISLACIAFVLIGVPLAVYIRPSGKSIGISIAFLLIMAYYGVWHYGAQLVRGGVWFGPTVVFLPNVLLTIIGAVMLHRTVHR
ncbi:LptF/LptG family permease [Candidatus Sumerlaeota bacterium]|nr:LptF/LptG family permease [Candidatus Sumerlaeota bacterium]